MQVGCWLLDPDHPPHSYADCCKLLSTDYPISDKVVCAYYCAGVYLHAITGRC